MTELSSGAKELVRAARAAYRVPAVDRQRILDGLRSRLGDGVVPDAPATSLWSPGSFVWKGVTVVAVCGLGAAAFLGLRTADDSTSAAPGISPAPSAMVAPAPAAVSQPKPNLEPELVPPSPSTPSKAQEPRRERRDRDRLAEEVLILSRAEADLHRGQAALALRSLDEHQRRFPDGALSVERRAARARALCTLGRAPEAKGELARLSRVARGSPLEARAREACDMPVEKR